MRFLARSTALAAAGALALVGLTAVPATAANTMSITSMTPLYYNAANASAATDVVVSGVARNNNDPVTVTITAGNAVIGTTNVTPSGSASSWTVSFSGVDSSTVPDGAITANAEESNPGFLGLGKYDDKSSKAITKDTTAPAAPVINGIPGSLPDGVISSSTPTTITAAGTGEPGATITLTLGTLPAATTTVLGNNNWSVNFDASGLADGTYTASAKQTDPAGNVSAAGTKTVLKDTVGPRNNTQTPSNGATIKSPSTVTFTYHDALGSNTSIAVKNSSGTAVAGTTAVNSSSATWTPGAKLGSGTYSATSTAYDVYGNKTVTTISFTVDATAPVLSNVQLSNTGTTTVASPDETVTGGVSEASTITVTATDSVGTKVTKSVSVDKPATFKVPYSENGLATGKIKVTVTAVDPYGNTSSVTLPDHNRTASTVISLNVPSASTVGQKIKLSGQVTQAQTTGFGSVTIVHTTLGGSQEIVATVNTNTAGAYAYTFVPKTSGTYYAIYNGDSKNAGVQSKTYSSQLRYAISVTVSTGAATTKAQISGAVHYPGKGTPVYIYKMLSDGSWKQIATAYVDSTNHYFYSLYLPKGTTKIKAIVKSSNGFFANSATYTATRT